MAKWVRRNKATAKRFLFSDEKIFDLNDHFTRTFWATRGKEPPQSDTQQSTPSVMAYAIIGIGFRWITVEDRTSYTAKKWNDEMLSKAIPALRNQTKAHNALLQMDNAPCHSEAKAYLNRRGISMIPFDWPGQSCDCNPTELVWSMLQRRVSEEGPTGLDELKAFIYQEFRKIPQSTIDDLVRSFVPTCEKVLRAEGRTVKP